MLCILNVKFTEQLIVILSCLVCYTLIALSLVVNIIKEHLNCPLLVRSYLGQQAFETFD